MKVICTVKVEGGREREGEGEREREREIQEHNSRLLLKSLVLILSTF